MTAVRLARGDLVGLDRLETDALALPMFEVRAQPRGVAGYVDWRSCGRIARLVEAGRFTGAADEALLMPSLGRVGAERIFLLGLGAVAAASDVSFTAAVAALADAGARKLAFGPPCTYETESDLELRRDVAARFVAAIGARKEAFDELLLLDPDDALSKGVGPLERAAKAAGLDWSA